MVASYFHWWVARIAELLPSGWTDAASRLQDGIVVDWRNDHGVTASIRRNGVEAPVGLGAAARMTERSPVFLRVPQDTVLTKHHIVPAAPRRELDQLLRHELARITPFSAESLFWRWDSRPIPGDRSRTGIALVMVPKAAVSQALAALDAVGLDANFVQVGPTERPQLLPVGEVAKRRGRTVLLQALASACAGLAVIAVILPFVLQALAIHRTESAITQLQPVIKQVQTFRNGLTASGAAQEVVARELERTGDPLRTLATITRILPDDTFLTDFSLRERQMTISGRTASAPRLITGLSADPAIRNPAFAAPVTRIQGGTTDVFSIKAGIVE